jgi:hypothetical protein
MLHILLLPACVLKDNVVSVLDILLGSRKELSQVAPCLPHITSSLAGQAGCATGHMRISCLPFLMANRAGWNKVV